MKGIEWDLHELEAMWDERARAVERAKLGIDVRGMTRPARAPYERAWLEAHGDLGPFVETDTPPVRGSGENPGPAPSAFGLPRRTVAEQRDIVSPDHEPWDEHG